jgi:hypothetical protein
MRTKEERKQDAREYRIKHPKKVLLATARVRAKKYDIPCTITEDDFEIPKYCPIFKDIEIKNHIGKGNLGYSFDSPTIERILSTEGFVPGNVRVVSMSANRTNRATRGDSYYATRKPIKDDSKWGRNYHSKNYLAALQEIKDSTNHLEIQLTDEERGDKYEM